ncbi:MAG: plasma-membrane proton-efflux P-type ATPase [Methanotrichaceae archaeon]|nr:plasma-membrane proton-efflux P-type ATPase [Methanotrichaceae archaeon]
MDSINGLSSKEGQERRKEYGYNQVLEKKDNPFLRLARHFWGITPWMLEITIILTMLLGRYLEAYIVIGLLLFNAALSFFQEEKANSALLFLKQNLHIKARVNRDGKWLHIPAIELVPGDLVRLRAGDFVPADVKVQDGSTDADQSALTGESLPATKGINDILFSGSVIRRGEVTAVVTAIGAKTYFGRTIQLVQTARPKLHMEEVTTEVVKWLLLMVGVFLLAGLSVSALRGQEFSVLLPLMVVLLLSAVPVALPTMFTITMALGSLELAKKGILVTRFSAGEDAATMNVLCVDKTGTITLNKLFIKDVFSFGSHRKEDIVLYGALASQEADQDPIDLAFLSASRETHMPLQGYHQIRFIPFDPSTRRTEAEIEDQAGRRFFVLKGAVSTITPLCKNNEEFSKIEEHVQGLAAKGYRVLAVAEGPSQENLQLIGIAALYDELRPDSIRLIGELKILGISIKMLTGDALQIAREVARQIGLGERASRRSDLNANPDEARKPQIAEESDVFAEVYPEDKYQIVKSLQRSGNVVGMTGDGVNDAPALRQAEVGIAVSSATDVAKEASSVVLTTEGLEGIVELVKTGRIVYQRIITWILNKVVKTFQVVVFVVLAFMLTGEYIVSIFSMVLFLLLTDFVTLSISTDNVRYSSKPDTWNIKGLVKVALVLGVLFVGESLLLLYFGQLHLGLSNIEQLRTFIFCFLVFSSLLNVIVVRERKHFWVSRPSKFLFASILADIVIVLLFSTFGIYSLAPIAPEIALFALAYSFAICFLVNDFIKVSLIGRLRVRL